MDSKGQDILFNSEMKQKDLIEAYNKHAGDARIADVVADMEKELGAMETKNRRSYPNSPSMN